MEDIGVGGGRMKSDIWWGGDIEGKWFENTNLISVAPMYFPHFSVGILVTGPSRYNETLFTRS